MQPANQITFGRFRLDLTNECLWEGTQGIALRPKAFAVLRLLVEHPGQLVTKQQLLDSVWPATYVSDAVLKASIRQLREAMDDDAEAPQYIETAHRRGYRFIGHTSADTATSPPASVLSGVAMPATRSAPAAALPGQPQPLLGREVEFGKLQEWLARALAGERQIVFVTGEPGIGKTTLVNELLRQASGATSVWIARGQCFEQYGAVEGYLPVLEGLSRLGRAQDGARITNVLRQHAPAWLLELPSLLPPEERETLRQQVSGATRERMLREMAEAIEAITAEQPLILVLEDLHWSDFSTVDLVAYLARRRDPARLMVIGTYRPVEMILGDHPLKAVKRELQAHGLSRELPLEYLTAEAVAQYLAVRFPGHQLPKRLAQLVHRRSEGNPLFMVNLAEYLAAERIIVLRNAEWQLHGSLADIESGIPDSIRQLIERQIERLSPDERRVLEGAAVVGMECSSVAIGAGLDEPTAWVEERCEALVTRYQFLSPGRLVELPDGTVTPRYKFSHVLYLEVPYRLLPAMRRSQIHRRVGHSGEAIYGDHVGEIAAELAMHFEQGADTPRAVKYLLHAARNAAQRSAHHEAEALARRGLHALHRLPPSLERDQQELGLRFMLGFAVMAIKSFAAAEVKEVSEAARALYARMAPSSQAFRVEWLLFLFHYFRAQLQPAEDIARQLVTLSDTLGDPFFVFEAHRASAATLVEQGQFEKTLEHLEQVSALYDTNRRHESLTGQSPRVVAECIAARALWALGFPDAALQRVERALSLAREFSRGESLLIAGHYAAHLHLLREEPSHARELAETVIGIAEEYSLPLWHAFGHMTHGAACVAQGAIQPGVDELRRGLAMYERTEATVWRPYYVGVLAQALARAGRVEEALVNITVALATVEATGERWCLAELQRIEGELRIQQAAGDADESPTPGKLPAEAATKAEECFRRAMATARKQHARSWELRASTSLGRLYHRQDKRTEARRIVRDALSWFTEGHDTADQKSAQALLNAPPLAARARS
ncbi:MAG: AAA family ATPase [Burkholderiales bacterium]